MKSNHEDLPLSHKTVTEMLKDLARDEQPSK
jgi:hypothetical protein